MLTGEIAKRLEVLLYEKAQEIAVDIQHLAIEPDHIHLFVSAPPDLAVSQVVYRLKGYTARILRQEFPVLLRMPSMWTSTYFASTAGQVSEKTIAAYIQAQGTRD